MIIWRVAKNKFASDLSGEGARLFGGRWNRQGDAMLYTSNHLSLSVLEIVTTIPVNMIKNDFSYLKIYCPDDVSKLKIEMSDLPNIWNSNSAIDYTKMMGSQWLNSQKSLMLMVPSIVIPEEENVLINPLHPEFAQLKIELITNLVLDSRIR